MHFYRALGLMQGAGPCGFTSIECTIVELQVVRFYLASSTEVQSTSVMLHFQQHQHLTSERERTREC